MSAVDDPSAVPAEPPAPRRRVAILASTAATLRLWLWAAAAGAIAAGATLAFRWLTTQIEWLFTRQSNGLVDAARAIAPWERPLVCAAGGLLAGLVLQFGARWVARCKQGDHYLDYIDAARQGRVDLNDRANLVRTVSAALSIGTGASIGREGPMVQLAAWGSAWLARIVPIRPEQRSAIMVCGIAAGIAAAYHAPVAGVVFVLELALGFFARHTVAPVLIASGTASALVYVMVDPRPLYATAPMAMLPSSIVFTLVASIAFGGFGWGFLKLVERSRLLFGRIASPALRLGLGGLLVGGLSAFVPEVWGNGYSVVSRALAGSDPWQWLALVLVTDRKSTRLNSSHI